MAVACVLQYTQSVVNMVKCQCHDCSHCWLGFSGVLLASWSWFIQCSIFLYVCMLTCLSVCLYVYVNVYMSICLYVYMFICCCNLFVRMCTCLSVCMCLFVYVNVYICICLYVYIVYLLLWWRGRAGSSECSLTGPAGPRQWRSVRGRWCDCRTSCLWDVRRIWPPPVAVAHSFPYRQSRYYSCLLKHGALPLVTEEAQDFKCIRRSCI